MTHTCPLISWSYQYADWTGIPKGFVDSLKGWEAGGEGIGLFLVFDVCCAS